MGRLPWFFSVGTAVMFACASPAGHVMTTAEPPSNAPRYATPPTLDIPDVDIAPDEPLDVAFERVLQAFSAHNLDPLDGRRAYATSAARGFARFLTVNDPDDAFSRTNHVAFVVTTPWETEATVEFLLSYLVMPGARVTDTGRSWYHFYSAYEPPLAIQFIFGNTALGGLEAAVMAELGSTAWAADEASDIVTRFEQLLDRFGLRTDRSTSGPCPAFLDEIYRALPHPTGDDVAGEFGQDYVPEGTLAGLGLVVGESIRIALAGAASWEGDHTHPLYPRLAVTGVAEGILRPIPMVIELFRVDSEVLPTDYCRRMIERLTSDASSASTRVNLLE